MPKPPQAGLELIPGYRLVKRLGAGGFGDVWQATAPGGLTKAVKIVFGNLQDTRAGQELRALSRIKEVRHPFLLSLERFEVIDGQLFIVTELADMSLQDRFQQCRQAGLAGIPRDELLGYLRDAADALDYISEHHGLQHLDIKPQNLLLVGQHIKIADFGQVKALQGTSVTATGGVTPLYAPPEAFDGRVSRHSDQYSLAIVYQEMLTGVRPFQGATALQLAAQHASSPPQLDPLPVADRPVVARALSKLPEGRFPSCREMVDSLIRAPSSPLLPVLQQDAPCPPPTPIVDVAAMQAEAPPAVTGPGSGREWDLSATNLELKLTSLPSDAIPTPTPVAPDAAIAEFPLRPTLVVGVGGLACATLRHLRQRLLRRFGETAMPILRLLLLDTDHFTLQLAQQSGPGEALAAGETLLVPLRGVEHHRGRARELLRWIERRWLYRIPRSQRPEGLRPLGRLALVDNAVEVLSALREALAAITSPEARATVQKTAGVQLRSDAPRVFLVASIAGGTGGGMFVDLAYGLRQVLGELELPAGGLCGVLLYATSTQPDAADLARVNAYAALHELNHFSRRDVPYPGDPLLGLAPCHPDVAPLDSCYLAHLGDELDRAAAEVRTDAVAEYLYLDAATAAGAAFDDYRRQTEVPTDGAAAGLPLRTFGLHRITFPRHGLARATANRLCLDLVEWWRGAVTEPVGATPIPLAPPAADCPVEYHEEALERRFHAAAQAIWGRDPESHFRALLATSPLCQTPPPPPRTVAGLCNELLQRIEEALGLACPARGGSEPAPASLQAKFHPWVESYTLALNRQIVQWLRRLVDAPAHRFSAADRAARWLAGELGRTAERVRSRLVQFSRRRAERRLELASPEVIKKGSGVRWLGLRRGPLNYSEQFLEYCWLCLGEITGESALIVLDGASADLTGCAEDLALGRERLMHWAGSLRAAVDAAAAADASAGVPHCTEVLPEQAPDQARAAETFLRRVGPELLRRLEGRLQADVLDTQDGLWGLVVGRSDQTTLLERELHARAREAVFETLHHIDVATLFLQSQGDATRAGRALRAAIAAAAPRLATPASRKHVFVALPPGPAAATLREAIGQSLTAAPTFVPGSTDDIVLIHEVSGLPLSRVAASLISSRPGCAEVARRVMTRVDVAWSPLAPLGT
jgi:serine/threonine protein kinase